MCILVSLTFLGGCATTGNPRDPLEPLNRGIYQFNDHVDNLLVKPAAEVYNGVVPQLARTGVSNFFSNINDVIVALNNLLQGKFLNAVSDLGRIAVNSTVGLLGLIDVATDIGLQKNNEDFGQTLGYWGIGDGPYLVLPLLGPSSFRDAVGWVGDFYAWPISYVDPTRSRNQFVGGRFLSRRAELLDASKILETAALDPYEFTRDAYLQRRRNLVYDGSPPPEKDDELEINGKPRSEVPADSPFPRSAGMEEPVNSVLVSGTDDRASAPSVGRTPLPPEQTSEPRAEAAPEPPRVVRIWTSTPSR
jgi:phospholipid-binding lipoprotein MlaA